MHKSTAYSLDIDLLRSVFGDRLAENVALAPYTSARVGGPADVFVVARSAGELGQTVIRLWAAEIPYLVLGGGSNVLVSDAGVRGVVVYNQARRVRFEGDPETPTVWAESGANFGRLARQAAIRGLSGLEWAAGIPGTVGGAVVGNAGAHGGDVAGSLLMAEILHRDISGDPQDDLAWTADSEPRFRQARWPVDRFRYAYRTSVLKSRPLAAVVLSASFRLERSTTEVVSARMDEFRSYRRGTQPPGASMGSMFKNPPGDYAGRLIQAAELKGKRIGEVEISPLHANFFINHGGATAQDVLNLIRMAQDEVENKFGTRLELEIHLVGQW
ncbi:MAG TPA: UDP-N-acetylmuramate dehydrogenase [Anaerolineales bacterium]|nr:UDP-N-acetylmuramate dehydrogenase [Anaerolineales bacterium]